MRILTVGVLLASLTLSACVTTTGGTSFAQSAVLSRTASLASWIGRECGSTALGDIQAAGFRNWPPRGTLAAPLYPGDTDTDLGNAGNSRVWRNYRSSGFRYVSDLVRSDAPVFVCEAQFLRGVSPEKLRSQIMRMFSPVAVASTSGRTHNGDTVHRSLLFFAGDGPALIYITGSDSSQPNANFQMFVKVPPNSEGKGGAQILRDLVAASTPADRAALSQFAQGLQRQMRADLSGELSSDASESQQMKADLRAKVEADRQRRGTTTGQMIAHGMAQGMSDFQRQETGFAQTRRAINGPSPMANGGADDAGNAGEAVTITLCAGGYLYPPERYRNSIPPVEWTCKDRPEAEAEMARRVAARDNAPKPKTKAPSPAPVRSKRVVIPCPTDAPCTTQK